MTDNKVVDFKVVEELDIEAGCILIRAENNYKYRLEKTDVDRIANILTTSFPARRVIFLGGSPGAQVKGIETFLARLKEKGVEAIWVDYRGESDLIKTQFPEIGDLDFYRWKEAVYLSQTIPCLGRLAKRAAEVRQQLAQEKQLLRAYPLAFNVSQIAMPVDDFATAIYKQNSRIVSEKDDKTVMLVSMKKRTGLIIKKSTHFKVRFTSPLFRGLLRPNLVILPSALASENLKSLHFVTADSNVEHQVWFERGKWEITAHPPISLLNPDFRYVPLAERLVRPKP